MFLWPNQPKCRLVGNAQVSVRHFWDDGPIGFDELSRQPKAMAGPSHTYLLKMPLGTHELFRNDRHICPWSKIYRIQALAPLLPLSRIMHASVLAGAFMPPPELFVIDVLVACPTDETHLLRLVLDDSCLRKSFGTDHLIIDEPHLKTGIGYDELDAGIFAYAVCVLKAPDREFIDIRDDERRRNPSTPLPLFAILSLLARSLAYLSSPAGSLLTGPISTTTSSSSDSSPLRYSGSVTSPFVTTR